MLFQFFDTILYDEITADNFPSFTGFPISFQV